MWCIISTSIFLDGEWIEACYSTRAEAEEALPHNAAYLDWRNYDSTTDSVFVGYRPKGYRDMAHCIV